MSCENTPRDDFEDHLETTLVARPVIEQAKGVVALARCATPDQAFTQIRRVAHAHSVGLRDLAAALVAAASGRPSDDAQLRKVIWHEWGNDFPNC